MRSRFLLAAAVVTHLMAPLSASVAAGGCHHARNCGCGEEPKIVVHLCESCERKSCCHSRPAPKRRTRDEAAPAPTTQIVPSTGVYGFAPMMYAAPMAMAPVAQMPVAPASFRPESAPSCGREEAAAMSNKYDQIAQDVRRLEDKFNSLETLVREQHVSVLVLVEAVKELKSGSKTTTVKGDEKKEDEKM